MGDPGIGSTGLAGGGTPQPGAQCGDSGHSVGNQEVVVPRQEHCLWSYPWAGVRWQGAFPLLILVPGWEHPSGNTPRAGGKCYSPGGNTVQGALPGLVRGSDPRPCALTHMVPPAGCGAARVPARPPRLRLTPVSRPHHPAPAQEALTAFGVPAWE